MELFGIGWMEVIFILILILLIAGPKDIEKGARAFGRFLNKLYRSPGYNAVRRASTELRNLPNRLAREAQLEELQSLKELDRDLRQDLQQTSSAVSASLSGRAPTPPAPPAPPASPAATSPPAGPAPEAAARADEAFAAWVKDLGEPPAKPTADRVVTPGPSGPEKPTS